MNNKQAMEQLKSLREFQYKFINDERFVDTEKIKNDIEALNMAIKVLERTALEVPVQEPLSVKFRDLAETKFKDLEGTTWK
ncbi:hypothetical protein [Clostridium butyricum]|uniref:hypothetical protein n=1 Tax=Clostridium butyricum TaxID=1492 RepID=UPI002AAF7EEE|nr:hypothetical protein [Clostridium butyricum]